VLGGAHGVLVTAVSAKGHRQPRRLTPGRQLCLCRSLALARSDLDVVPHTRISAPPQCRAGCKRERPIEVRHVRSGSSSHAVTDGR
jgi:hypothetical protein